MEWFTMCTCNFLLDLSLLSISRTLLLICFVLNDYVLAEYKQSFDVWGIFTFGICFFKYRKCLVVWGHKEQILLCLLQSRTSDAHDAPWEAQLGHERWPLTCCWLVTMNCWYFLRQRHAYLSVEKLCSNWICCPFAWQWRRIFSSRSATIF